MNRHIITIDPGSIITGWAYRHHEGGKKSGVIEQPAKLDSALRINRIVKALSVLLDAGGFNAALIEVPDKFLYITKGGGKRSIHSMLILSRAIGAIMNECLNHKMTIFQVTPQEWKGTVSKQVTMLEEKRTDDNEADALGLLRWWDAIGVNMVSE
jgi:Holliday junction resolvasome RuvABC endonuclease subunit